MQGLDRAPDDLFQIFLHVWLIWPVCLHDLIYTLIVLIESLLQVFNRQALRVSAFIGHALNAPLTLFSHQHIALPEPVPPRLLINRGSLLHLSQRTASKT